MTTVRDTLAPPQPSSVDRDDVDASPSVNAPRGRRFGTWSVASACVLVTALVVAMALVAVRVVDRPSDGTGATRAGDRAPVAAESPNGPREAIDSPPIARPTPDVLAALPAEFPSSIARTARAGASRDADGARTVTLVLMSSTTPGEDLFALAERLRGAGWNVDPLSHDDGFAFRGFGWDGQAAPTVADGAAALVVELRRPT